MEEDAKTRINPEEVAKVANAGGLEAAAKKFGKSPATISRMLRTHGYTLVRQYVKNPQPSRN